MSSFAYCINFNETLVYASIGITRVHIVRKEKQNKPKRLKSEVLPLSICIYNQCSFPQINFDSSPYVYPVDANTSSYCDTQYRVFLQSFYVIQDTRGEKTIDKATK